MSDDKRSSGQDVSDPKPADDSPADDSPADDSPADRDAADPSPSERFAAIKERVVRDLETGAQTAKELWQTTLAPGLRDLGTRARRDGGKAVEQASDVFSTLGRRLSKLGRKP